jgi:hypothetical protein
MYYFQLPEDMEVIWNVRLTKTAGYCTYKKSLPNTPRSAKIELSTKVCNTAGEYTSFASLSILYLWLILGFLGK